MNILVIGGTRLMGRNLVHELLSNGHSVTIATRGITKDNFNDKVKRIRFDRAEEESIKAVLSNQHFDLVYDSLAYCSNDIKRLLEHIQCEKYIEISSASVYDNLHNDTKEEEFQADKTKLLLCERNDFGYNEGKRQAESAIVQLYPHIPSIRVRFPFVIGEDDYTNRLYFYVEHIINQTPMYINNFESQMSFIHSNEAGQFLAYLADQNFCGAINGANKGTISIKDTAEYIKQKTGKEIPITDSGEKAPYNSIGEYSINTDKADQLGYSFTPVNTQIYNLLDKYISKCQFPVT